MGPPNRISFDRIADLYDGTRGLPSEQMEAILEVLLPEFSRHKLVLEVGVGTGRFALPLAQRGVRILGVDIAQRMVAKGVAKGLRDVLFGDALHLPFKDKVADAVYTIHVLHLIEDWKGALRELSRVTRYSYYTVATYHEENPSPYRAYWDLLKEEGFERLRPGIGERDLPEIVPPATRKLVGTFDGQYTAAEAIGELEDRIFSAQWNLPDEAHERAMLHIKGQFHDQLFSSHKRIEVLRWDVESLATVQGAAE